MTTYYCGPNGDDGNDGLSEATAYLTDIPFVRNAVDGDVLKVPCGYVIDRALDEDDTNITFAASGLTIESYGSGAKPVFTRALRNPTWVADSSGTYSLTLSGNCGGFAEEDGRPMLPVTWNTNIATTAASMTAGSMTFDPFNFKYYIKPTSGDPANHSYIVSAGAKTWQALDKSRIVLRGVAWEYAGQGPFFYGSGGGYVIEDFECRKIGGWYGPSGTNIQGDGITMAGNWGPVPSYVRRGLFEDVLDCAFFPQQWENSKTMRNVFVSDCVARRCGLVTFGATVIGSLTNSIISNVIYENCVAEDNGLGYAGNRGGIAFSFNITTSDAGSSVEGVSAINCIVRRGYIGARALGCSARFTGLDISGIRTQGILFDRGSRGGEMRASGCVIRDPANSTGSAVWHNGSSSSGSAQVNNCTIVGSWLRGQMVNLTGGAHRTNNTIHVGCTTGVHRNNPAVTPVATNCLFYQCGTNTSSATNTNPVLADPLLDASYRPRSGSPVIGAGTKVAGMRLRDFYGKEIDRTPDIGAVQRYAARSVIARTPITRTAATRTAAGRRAVYGA